MECLIDMSITPSLSSAPAMDPVMDPVAETSTETNTETNDNVIESADGPRRCPSGQSRSRERGVQSDRGFGVGVGVGSGLGVGVGLGRGCLETGEDEEENYEQWNGAVEGVSTAGAGAMERVLRTGDDGDDGVPTWEVRETDDSEYDQCIINMTL